MEKEAQPKDWLNEGLDTVEEILNSVQASYDALPDKQKSAKLLNHAISIIDQEIVDSYKCQFDNTKKIMNRVAKTKNLKDPEKNFKRIERAISRDVRECFKQEYGDIL